MSGRQAAADECLHVTEAGDEGSNSSAAQRRTDETALTMDVKCTSLAARDNDSTAAALTSAHVTANEHDHMVSSTIHSDGQSCWFAGLLSVLFLQ